MHLQNVLNVLFLFYLLFINAIMQFLLSCTLICSFYIDRRVTKVEDFLKTRLLDTLTDQMTKVLKVRFSA